MESKACTACSKARRKCDKQIPHCLRCQTKSLRCRYRPSKPSNFIVLKGQTPSIAKPPSFDVITSCLTSPVGANQTETWWFASPETWTIDAAPPSLTANPRRFTAAELNRLLSRVIEWLKQWIDHGSNPFIHSQLYRYRFPQCIQDAFMSLSCYFQKTAANEHIISRILEDRVTQLVAQGVPVLRSEHDGQNMSARAADMVEYLARVQALLVYQCIGLYDGSVRLRYLAEQHMPVLERWLIQLLDHNSRGMCCGDSLISSLTEDCSSALESLGLVPCEYVVWLSWILAESTRRTWLITAGVQGVYKLLQNGTSSCLGGTMFTSRQGFWEAPSAMAWEKKCSEVYAGQVRLTEVDKLLATVPLGELSEFTKVVLECRYGVEQTERWGVRWE